MLLAYLFPINSKCSCCTTLVPWRVLCILSLPVFLLLTIHGPLHAATAIAGQAKHTVWTTPGTLIEVRLPRRFDALAARLLDAPEGAVLLENPDDSDTFFWVPSAADIGIRRVAIQLNAGSGQQGQLYQLQIDVLESESLPPRLNPLPELQLSTSLSATRADGIHRLAAGQTYELLAVARDTGEKPPRLNLHGAASSALWQAETAASYRLEWTPGEADIGYSNLTVYAVDGDRPAQYSSRDLNLLVQAQALGDREDWLDKRFEIQPQDKPVTPGRTQLSDQQVNPAMPIVSGSLP